MSTSMGLLKRRTSESVGRSSPPSPLGCAITTVKGGTSVGTSDGSMMVDGLVWVGDEDGRVVAVALSEGSVWVGD